MLLYEILLLSKIPLWSLKGNSRDNPLVVDTIYGSYKSSRNYPFVEDTILSSEKTPAAIPSSGKAPKTFSVLKIRSKVHLKKSTPLLKIQFEAQINPRRHSLCLEDNIYFI